MTMQLSQIDVNLLVSLDTLLRERSVTGAAKRLGLSQSAMSHQLRRLRELFDDPILVGGRGGMVTTPLAETLEGPIRRALLDLGRAIRGELSFDPATAERTFTIATKDSVELLGLPPLLELLSREAPGIRLHGRPIGPSTFSALQEGDVDLVIGPDVEQTLGVPFPGLRRRVLSRSGHACVVRAGHPVVARAQREGGLSLERYLGLRHPLAIALGYVVIAVRGLCIQAFLRMPKRHWGGPLALAIHAAGLVVLSLVLGPLTAVLVWMVPVAVNHAFSAYLFYAQHNFPETRFFERGQWDYTEAALHGSSFLETNPVMQWLTANIGFHHVHHLNHKIPFYRLPEAMAALEELQAPHRTSFHPADVAACLRLRAWDPARRRMTSAKAPAPVVVSDRPRSVAGTISVVRPAASEVC